jgi:hypothetical protein
MICPADSGGMAIMINHASTSITQTNMGCGSSKSVSPVLRRFRPVVTMMKTPQARSGHKCETEMENGFGLLVRLACTCSGQYESGLDGSR